MPYLLAATAQKAHDTILTIGLIAAILGIIVLVLQIINLTRRKPSHTEYTDREVSRCSNLAKSEVSRVERRLDEHITKNSGAVARLHQKVEDQGQKQADAMTELTRQMGQGFQDLSKQIGFIQGKLTNEDKK